jgi:DNA invertase Pin-like site-specific DNA recombinase
LTVTLVSIRPNGDLIERIGKAGAAFRSLGDPLWDTSSSQGKLPLAVLAAIAEFERDLIKERTGDGRRRAQAAGVKFGRKPASAWRGGCSGLRSSPC